MRNIISLLGSAALLGLTGCTSTPTAADSSRTAASGLPTQTAPSMHMAKHFHLQKTQALDLHYLLFLPQGYNASSPRRWPLLLFLHGIGERGSDVWKVATHGPPKIVTEHPEFPFILVSPQCPEGQMWSNETLLALLDEITRAYAVDTHRVYLTGLSMGGYGAWNLGLAHPERFAAIVPICGGGDLITLFVSARDKPEVLKSLAVWAFHGAKDPVVPLVESERMVGMLKHAGVREVKFTVYPEAGHDSWTETYKNPEVYDWLLKHELK